MKCSKVGFLVLGVTVAMTCGLSAQETMDPSTLDPATLGKLFPKAGYSPYAGRTFPSRPLFGDTHLHTSQSFDAIAFGTLIGPEDAYRFARGEEVTTSTGQHARLSRPLDFMVVADHAENMGVLGEIKAGNPALMSDPDLKRWNQMLQGDGEQAMRVYYEIMTAIGTGKPLPPAVTSVDIARSIWKRTSRPPSNTTIPESSPHSSATSGRRTPKATTSTAWWCSATAASVSRRYCRFPALPATIPRTSGRPSRLTRTRPVAAFLPFRITAICPTVSCFRSSIRSAAIP